MNGTLEEINGRLWVLMLKVASYEAHFCDQNERPVLDPDTGLIKCPCQPDKTCEQNMADAQFEKALLALLVIVGIAWLMYKLISLLWSRRPDRP